MLKKIWLFGKFLPRWIKLILLILLFACVGVLALQIFSQTRSNSPLAIGDWFGNRDKRSALITPRQACAGAPFILPSDGFIGLLWNDPAGPYNVLNRHTGIDIFGDGGDGEVPVYAVYDGYLTRLEDWLSSVIIRHDDPLQEGRTIWSYYTHMASEDGKESYIVKDFPPATHEKFVEQGTLLGYQGRYAGSATFAVGLHVHLSLVLSDEDGMFKNESVLANTLDPSPYFGMPLKIDSLPTRPIQCARDRK